MNALRNAKVTVLGLGLHGGGVETVRYLARHGARVTVTDAKPADRLKQSIAAIEGLTEKQVFGRHDPEDIRTAEFVVKNPAIPRTAEILHHARRIESDISLFLQRFSGTLIAITGSKGKSSVASLVHAGILTVHADARLGGNITRSPLSFLDDIAKQSPVVLELSSFQLGDLRMCRSIQQGDAVLHPDVAVITNIFADHQNYYNDDMEAYVRDKAYIFAFQRDNDALVLGCNSYWTNRFARLAPGRVRVVAQSGFGPMDHNRKIATAALDELDVSGPFVEKAIGEFAGLEHRLEYVGSLDEVEYYNDSAATVPEAIGAALSALGAHRTILIAGGTDKHLDLSEFTSHVAPARELVLISGSATMRMQKILDSHHVSYHGPFSTLEAALQKARGIAAPGDRVVFSPGAASFELFENEFERGRAFKQLVGALPSSG